MTCVPRRIPVSVIVATRNRNDAAVRTVRSVLANSYPEFELIVIDQSQCDTTRLALDSFATDRRFRYCHTAAVGLQRARNTGALEARHGIVVTTDDDCEVPPNWLGRFVDAFAMDDSVAAVFGRVTPAPHDRARGFIPAYDFQEPFVASRVSERHRIDGMGACFGFRQDVWSALNGFDPMMGKGSRFRSAGESDFALRALVAGYRVCQCPRIEVLHHGFRSWNEGETLVRGYLFGVGAFCMKHLRQRHWGVLRDLAAVGGRFVSGGGAVETGGPRNSVRKLGAFLRGATAGLIAPLDDDTGHFAEV